MKKIMFFAVCMIMACSSEQVTQSIVPLPAGYSVDSLQNAYFPARFTLSDFDWQNGILTVEAFSENLYDAVEISQLSRGDTILYWGNSIVVDSIGRDGDIIEINGGLGEENGAWIQAHEGGTWRAIQFDDHSVYSSVGKVSLHLSADFMIVDCGEQYGDPSDTVSFGQREYIEGLATIGRTDFFELNTKVLVENGNIISIVRRWIP